jgi:hypothetical protein
MSRNIEQGEVDVLNVKRGGAILIAIFASACSGSAPTTPTQSPTAAAPSLVANLVGNYTLTVEIDDTCAVVPQSERVRRYDAIVDASPWASPSEQLIRVVGGGFTEPTTMGRFFSSDGNSRFIRLDWNSFDFPGCDTLEPLPDSRRLALCGSGTPAMTDSTVSAVIAGNAAIMGSGYCTGSHRFTFVRRAQ